MTNAAKFISGTCPGLFCDLYAGHIVAVKAMVWQKQAMKLSHQRMAMLLQTGRPMNE